MNKYILVLILTIGIFSCRKDKDIVQTIENEYPVEEYVISSIKGKVITSRDIPVEEATIIIGENSIKTDFNGVFYFKDIKTNLAGTTIVVKKNGFSESRRVFYPQLGATSYVKIKIKENRKTSIISTTDKDKKVGDKSNSITILGDKFSKDGDEYRGDIVIDWDFVAGNDDPDKQFGDPIGFNKYFKLVGLNSYGTLGINITDANNNRVKLDDGNSIELRLGINPIHNNLNDKIALWHYDNKKEKWFEKGEARLINENETSYYLAEVKESGYYNFAKSFEIEKTKIEIGSNNVLLPYTQAVISVNNTNNYNLNLNTNSEGVIPCFIPSEEKSKINVILKDKNTEKNLVVTSVNKVEVENKYIRHTLSGVFYNCNDQLIENGYITIYTGKDSIFYFIGEHGVFSETIITEESEDGVFWIATDLDTKINTGVHKTKLKEEKELTIGDIYLCKEPFALMRYGDDIYLLDLYQFDDPSLSVEFKKGKARYSISSYPFLGVGNYNINNCNCTPLIQNKDGDFLYSYWNLEHEITIKEHNIPGFVRGGLKVLVRTGFEGTDTTLVEIDYSVNID